MDSTQRAMRILSYLNISNPDDLSADSGVVFQRMIARAFSNAGDGFAVIGHPSASRLFTGDAEATYFSIDVAITKYGARYYFNWPAILEVILSFRPDVVFVNQMELCAHFQAVLAGAGIGCVPVVGYCHYVPIDKQLAPNEEIVVPDSSLNDHGLGECVLLAFAEGVVAADIVMVQSDYAKRMLLTVLRRFRLQAPTHLLVAAPPADPRFTAARPPTPPRSRKIIYNHRLYGHYETRAFVDFMKDLRRRIAFELVICDPMPNRSEARDRLDDSVGVLRQYIHDSHVGTIHPGGDRHHYRSLLNEARLGFSSFQRGCVWSMSMMDLMGLGIPVVAPRYGAYPELVPQSLIFDTLDEAEALTEAMLTDDDRWSEASALVMAASRRHTAEAFRSTFVEGLALAGFR